MGNCVICYKDKQILLNYEDGGVTMSIVKDLLEKGKKEKKKAAAKKAAKGAAVGAAVGTAVGVAAGVLLAPKAGKETREDLAKKAKETGEGIAKKAKVAVENIKESVEKIKPAKKTESTAEETKE